MRAIAALGLLLSMLVAAGCQGGAASDDGGPPGSDGGPPGSDGGPPGSDGGVDAAMPHDAAATDGSDGPAPAGGPRIVVATCGPTSVIVAVRDVVADYGADATGGSDVTALFQKAIDEVHDLGGGTVWAPAGTYRFDGSLVIPSSVTLRGDWRAPTDADASVCGTVLALHDTTHSFALLDGAGGLAGLTFWYPDQSIANPTTMPPTLALDPSSPNQWRALSVRDSTFVNSWQIMDTSPTMGKGKGIVLANLYGSPLALGLHLSDTSSICRANHIHLGARYWAKSKLPGAPTQAALAAYMQANATGLIDEDNWLSTDISLDDFAIALELDGPYHSSPKVTGQRMEGLEISGANVGVHITNANLYVNVGSITADAGQNPVAISIAAQDADQNPTTGTVLLSEVTLSSSGTAIDNGSADYTVHATNSTFASWTGYAVSSAGAVMLEGDHFGVQSGGGIKDLSLAATAPRGIIVANTYAGNQTTFAMDNAAPAKRVAVIEGPLTDPTLAALGISGFPSSGLTVASLATWIPPPPKPARVGVDSLYDVTAYGAKPDCVAGDFDDAGTMTGGCTDDTAPFQAALDAAGKAGGGTVYVPGSPHTIDGAGGGYFFAGHLQVPSGVELTGAPQDASFHALDTQTALFVQGDASPFMTLAASAGVRGVELWYTNQNGYAVPDFGYAIQAQGKGDWVDNVIVVNATRGLDFGSYDTTGHYIAGYSGASLKNGLFVSKSANGIIDGLDSGATSWLDLDKGTILSYPSPHGNPPGATCTNGAQKKLADTDVGCPADLYASGVALLLGSAKNEVIHGAYLHAPHVGLQAIDDGGGPSFTLVDFGSETYTGIDLEALDPAGATIVASQYHTISDSCYPNACGDSVGEPYLVVGSAVAPTTPIRFIGYANHSMTPTGFDLSGGTTIISQYITEQSANTVASVQTAVAVHGAQTGFALLGARFLLSLTAADPKGGPANPNATVIADDASKNVALVGAWSLDQPAPVTGPVDVAFQP
jgi:hypothetical protein